MRLFTAIIAFLWAAYAYAQSPTQVLWGNQAGSPPSIVFKSGSSWIPIGTYNGGVFSPTLPTLTSQSVACNPTGATATAVSCTTLPNVSVGGLNYTATGTGGTSQTLSQILSNIVLVDNYGATHDGTTDDTAHLVNAMAALGSQGGTVLLSCAYNYAILTSVTIPANVTVHHCRGYGGNPGVDWATGPIASQPHVNLASTASIMLSSNSGYKGVVIRNGMTIPVQTPVAYAGTAFTFAAAANDTVLDILAVGFAKCVDSSSSVIDRYKWSIECDANPGATEGAVIIGQSLDSSVANIRTYPWGTVAYPTTPTLTRTGYGTQIVAGFQDDSRLDIFDYGHTIGLVSAANGNIYFSHIWTDNNSSYGIQFDDGDRIDITSAWVYTSKGVRFNASGVYNFSYLMEDSGAVAAASSIETSGAATPIINIGTWYVAKATSYAANLGATTKLYVTTASLQNVNGGAEPYIVGGAGWTVDSVTIQNLHTDLPAGNVLYGGNPRQYTTIASSASITPTVMVDEYEITGAATITIIGGSFGGNHVVFHCSSSATAVFTSGGNINLQNGTDYSCVPNGTISFEYDANYSAWVETARSPVGIAAISPGAAGTPPAAGTLGEEIESSIPVGSSVAFTSTVTGDVTSVNLSAGNWFCYGNVITDPAGTTTSTHLIAAINTTSATLPTPPNDGSYFDHWFALSGGLSTSLTAGQRIYRTATPITVYLVANVTFATSTMGLYGYLGCIRQP